MNFIESKANVMMGKPVIAGTRITVECLLVRLAGLPTASKTAILINLLEMHRLELPGSFTVVSPGLVRIRSVPVPGASS